ncbi:MAG: purine-nucleoside phosphorylase [Cyclobacteriaceae bacterium]|nr:purine-nucleoside phosphorylase [Cyclobacteriaceae bacterium HetDA_MAG_MS6]
MVDQVNETVAFLKEKGFEQPEIGIVLGTGLGALAEKIDIEVSLEYEHIPNFPIATIEFHHGKLLFGTLEGKKVIAMQGRFHFYEGYNLAQVVFPIRVMKYLGIKNLFISNAAGNMNLDWKKGQLMLIDDHINLLPDNPLRGNGAATFGSIFADMSCPYDSQLNQALSEVAQEEQIQLNKGIYVAVAGPSLETRAEYRFLRQIGADAVGMSTVPEVIAANQMGLPTCAVSVLTDDCDPDNLEPVNIEDIIAIAKTAEKDLVTLFRRVIAKL